MAPRNRHRMVAALKYPLIPLGTKFGLLVVLENDRRKEYRSQRVRACRVRCDGCGTKKILTYGELRGGGNKSCGCRRIKPPSLETIWKDLHRSIEARGRGFDLTLEELKIISLMDCAYCGKKPSNIRRVKYKVDGVYKRRSNPSLEIRYSGIDRIDSTKGYVLGNMVPCCFECNGVKSKLPLDDFIALIRRIHSHNPTASGIRSLAATLFHSRPGMQISNP